VPARKTNTPKAKKAPAKKKAGKEAAVKKSIAQSETKRGPEASEVAVNMDDDPALRSLAEEVWEPGGAPLTGYREPLSGRPILLASLPLKAVERTPFQRDLSPAHVKRLAQKIEESRSFLDPLIVVRGTEGLVNRWSRT
jgi:ParB family chromosome partitioning protein